MRRQHPISSLTSLLPAPSDLGQLWIRSADVSALPACITARILSATDAYKERITFNYGHNFSF